MFNLPNALTIMNLLCGCLAVVSVFYGNYEHVAIFFGGSLVFDLLDGLAARGLQLSSALGAELDSLADMISFGLLPGIAMFWALGTYGSSDVQSIFPSAIAFVYTAAAALRLAKFNLDERQTKDFLGLNTPAASIALMGIYFNTNLGTCPEFIQTGFSSIYVAILILIILSILLLLDLPMLSFKPSFQDKERSLSQLFLIVGGVIILIIMKTCALPFLILWYILYSIGRFALLKRNK